MTAKLNSQQRLRLDRTMQTALDSTAVSLRMMLGGEVKIGLARVSSLEPSIIVRLGLRGALTGKFYIDLPENMAIEIVKTLTAERDLPLFDKMARSALMEMGNVIASVFVSYFDQHRGLRTLSTPPELSFVPLDIPVFAKIFTAQFFWSRIQNPAVISIGLEQSALDILLAS